jgi:hypothetical protein
MPDLRAWGTAPGGDPTDRRPLDLRRLPRWLQYVIALAVVALVVAAAWAFGGDRPVPSWITGFVIPALGWLYVGLFIYFVLHAVASRLAKRR